MDKQPKILIADSDSAILLNTWQVLGSAVMKRSVSCLINASEQNRVSIGRILVLHDILVPNVHRLERSLLAWI
jgi:hypothetical protein